MYLEVLLINHWMEDNLEIHREEFHPKEIHLEDHHLIHLSEHLDGQHLTVHVYAIVVLTTCATYTKTNNQATI
jgi:hypothetical protein